MLDLSYNAVCTNCTYLLSAKDFVKGQCHLVYKRSLVFWCVIELHASRSRSHGNDLILTIEISWINHRLVGFWLGKALSWSGKKASEKFDFLEKLIFGLREKDHVDCTLIEDCECVWLFHWQQEFDFLVKGVDRRRMGDDVTLIHIISLLLLSSSCQTLLWGPLLCAIDRPSMNFDSLWCFTDNYYCI